MHKMPTPESLAGPTERSNYLNANYPLLESNYLGGQSPANGYGYGNGNSLRLPLTGPSKTMANKIVIDYDNMFATTDNNSFGTNLPILRNAGNGGAAYTPLWMSNRDDDVSILSEGIGMSNNRRYRGGSTRTYPGIDKMRLSPRMRPPGVAYFENKKRVNVISLNMMATDYKSRYTNFRHRAMFAHRRPTITSQTRTRGTQSLYRESSAQTLPYLPPVSNEPDELESMELFKLPTILPGHGAPGLYEVEVLERARKRWAFAKALKDNFRQQLDEARHQVKLPQHEHILEAFEWEHWIEREEYIQECQMLRLEILMRMFDKRERQMRNASHARIQHSYAQIDAKRKLALQKNEIEFSRSMRRLEMQHSKRPRVWRKEQISQGLGDPTSEFYAPKLRYGIDPSRRHFSASRKGFDMRMNDLERRTVKMDPDNLKCPFAKLKAWSKPKEVMQEVEQNFCSETNLKKLYESLKDLRETTERPKMPPLCLMGRDIPPTIPEEPDTIRTASVTIREEVATYEYPMEEQSIEDPDKQKLREEYGHQEFLLDLQKEKLNERQWRKHLKREMSQEEFESLLQSYEGNTIGWLMRFLSEEMSRLKEQRKLHFYSMLAKRESYRREAAEAGLRQKENSLRNTYEKIYEECNEANVETAEHYMHSILDDDAKSYAEEKAQDYVVALAKDLDKEIGGWLESFHDVQNPLNYDKLRHALRDIVVPDFEKVLYRLERDDCIDYIVNGVLMPNVYQSLEPFDISFAVATDFVDGLIDNDLYRESSDFCSDCESSEFCTCAKARQEAKTIMRKLIRHSVTGKRWRSPTERVADENVRDILDGVFDNVMAPKAIIEADKATMEVADENFSYLDLTRPQRDTYFSEVSQGVESVHSSDFMKVDRLSLMPPSGLQDITRDLQRNEQLLLADTDLVPADNYLQQMDVYEYPQPRPTQSTVRKIPSTHDISSVWDFNKAPSYCRTSSDEIPIEEEQEQGQYEDYEVGYPKIGGDEFEEVRRRIDAWSVENSSTHSGYEEQDVEPGDEGGEQLVVEVEIYTEAETTATEAVENDTPQNEAEISEDNEEDNELKIEEIFEPEPPEGDEDKNDEATEK
uniref:Cilia- and flagella-associated protein 91 n=1 Tax=Stomoxys calcitrans TaxID=35570 RepID=A0A1I8PWA4_STOCA